MAYEIHFANGTADLTDLDLTKSLNGGQPISGSVYYAAHRITDCDCAAGEITTIKKILGYVYTWLFGRLVRIPRLLVRSFKFAIHGADMTITAESSLPDENLHPNENQHEVFRGSMTLTWNNGANSLTISNLRSEFVFSLNPQDPNGGGIGTLTQGHLPAGHPFIGAQGNVSGTYNVNGQILFPSTSTGFLGQVNVTNLRLVIT